MKANQWHIFCVGWLMMWVGIAMASVGQMSPSEPYPLHLPFTIFVFVITPMALGFVAGVQSERNRNKGKNQ